MKLFPLSEMQTDILDTQQEIDFLYKQIGLVRYEIERREVFIAELQDRINNKQYIEDNHESI